MKRYVFGSVIAACMFYAFTAQADNPPVTGQGDAYYAPYDAAYAPAGYVPTHYAPAISLATETGITVGGQISDYRYQEHVVAGSEFMHETGAKFGLTATGTQAFAYGLFAAADLRFAYGSNDYSSPTSGTQSGLDDYLWDVRLLGGKDFVFQNVSMLNAPVNFSVSPYLGLGYRNLFNDARGTTSLGYSGYRRDSQYLYLPLGVTPRFRVASDARISATIEYDQLLWGQENSDLSDASPIYPNITNTQNSGYGLRGSIMYEEAHWSLGPFFDYWNINQSKNAYFTVLSIPYYGYEPHNQTIEYGMQVAYKF